MASVLFEEMQKELDSLGKEYFFLLEKLEQTGDFDIFADFDGKLCQMMEMSYDLQDTEERLEIVNNIVVLRNGMNSLLHSAY